jgi:mRNA interferase MazF
MVVKQGDVFLIDFGEPSGSESGYRHPHVVIQNNVFNRSRLSTVVVCAFTLNLKRAKAPKSKPAQTKRCEHISNLHSKQKRSG